MALSNAEIRMHTVSKVSLGIIAICSALLPFIEKEKPKKYSWHDPISVLSSVGNVYESHGKMFGNVTVEIKNGHGRGAKDFVLLCDGRTKTDTIIETSIITVYEKTYGKIKIRDVDLGYWNRNVKEINCHIIDFVNV
jgi:hypothetical protein